RLNGIQQSHVKSIAASLWNMDVALLTLQMEGVVRLPGVVGVSVQEDGEQSSDPLSLTIGHMTGGESFLQRTYSLDYSESERSKRHIGHLQVNASLEEVYSRLLDKALVILAGQGVKTFLVSLFILLMIHRLVTRHLIAISRHVAALDLQTPVVPLRLARDAHHHDELEMVANSLNRMHVGLEHAYQELREQTQLLEQRVLERDRAKQSQEALSNLLATALEPLDMQGQLQKALTIILKISWLHLEPRGAIFLMAEQEERLLLTAHYGLSEATTKACASVRLGDCLCGRVAQSRERASMVAAKEIEDPHCGCVVSACEHDGFPIIHQETILGVLKLFITPLRALNTEEQQLIASFADALAGLIHAKRNEGALREAKRRAESASQVKSEFLAVMSHEIRTPMNAIMGMAEMIVENGGSTTEMARYATVMQRNGRALLTLINDVLDMTKIEAEELPLHSVPFDLAELVDESMAMFQTTSREKGVALTSHLDPSLLPRRRGDPVRLRQVFVNLLGNAVKFTDHGSIALEGVQHPDDTERLTLSVTDTGIGIPEAQKEKVFELFHQADSSLTRNYGGVGLGLHLCRQLVTMMGGTLAVESRVGVGSRFHFSLALPIAEQPIATPANRPQPMPPPELLAGLAGKRILLAEDAEDNVLLVRVFLKSLQIVLEVTENGKEALERYRKAPHDLVLMDIQMPVMNGFTATREIRAWEQANSLPPVPIVALTAFTLQEDREKARAAGCNGYLSKPITKATLL
ncbi:MAG: response regulator, partial [Magnetococcales bacterium]|nr:response regulator [Magnetococcales bacterium]